jgi:hypothetical protein
MPDETDKNKSSIAKAAEFHDIGKLIDWKAVGLQTCGATDIPTESEPHDFEKCTGQEWSIDWNAVQWQAIYRKDETTRNSRWPQSLLWAWTSLADQLAAGWGRPISEQQIKSAPIYGRHILWSGQQSDDKRLKNKKDVHDMITFLNTSPSWQQAIEKYGDLWCCRPETARPGLNVTSLVAHSEVAGKLARVLASAPSPPFQADWVWRQIEKSLDKFKLTVSHFRIHIPQRPFRIADWNVFEECRQTLEFAIQSFADNVIGSIPNECIAVFVSPEQANDFAQVLIGKGFGVLRRQAEKPLSDLMAHGIMTPLDKSDWEHVYPNPLPEQIDLPICECCQMAHAEYCWPLDRLLNITNLSNETRSYLRERSWRDLRIDDFPLVDRNTLQPWLEEYGQEELCSRCFELRQSASRLQKLHTWEADSVAWVHISVDIAVLTETLKLLHQEYLRRSFPNIGQRQINELYASYPLLVDLLNEFRDFLRNCHQTLTSKFSEEGLEHVDNNLWCVRLNKRSDAITLLRIYHQLLQQYFPVLCNSTAGLKCPIRLAISVSPVKHPFFVHWRFLEEPFAEVALQVVGSGRAGVSLQHLSAVLDSLGHSKRGALHRLNDISRTSPALAELVLKNYDDRDGESFQKISPLLRDKIDFQSLLTLTNLAED